MKYRLTHFGCLQYLVLSSQSHNRDMSFSVWEAMPTSTTLESVGLPGGSIKLPLPRKKNSCGIRNSMDSFERRDFALHIPRSVSRRRITRFSYFDSGEMQRV